jgi:hypothetical protein
MAGGLAILLGTLLGISFPMGGGQNTAQLPAPKVSNKTSKVLPANINVNSTASDSAPSDINSKTTVAQNNNTSPTNDANDSSTTTGNSSNQDTNTANEQTQTSNKPIQALW